MKNCELCKRVARTHCESDQAYLCWSCDFKVHSANFLVARHSRTLLCRVCQSPTPWTAAGSNFCPTLSVCRDCFASYKFTAVDDEESRAEKEIAVEEEEEEEVVGNADEEDVDIQVVPWSPSTPPPNSEGEGEGERESCRSSSSSSSPTRLGAQRKRKLEVDTDLRLNGVSYLDTAVDGGGGTEKMLAGSFEGTRLTKRRTGSSGEIRVGLPGSKTWGMVERIVRLDRTQGSRSAAMISELCSLG